MYKCRFCHEEITHLCYSQRGTEYGTCEMDGDGMDRDGVDSEDSPTFRCPECDHEEDEAEDIWEEMDEDDESESEEGSGPDAITEENAGRSRTRMGSFINNNSSIDRCTYCRQPCVPTVACQCRADQ